MNIYIDVAMQPGQVFCETNASGEERPGLCSSLEQRGRRLRKPGATHRYEELTCPLTATICQCSFPLYSGVRVVGCQVNIQDLSRGTVFS